TMGFSSHLARRTMCRSEVANKRLLRLQGRQRQTNRENVSHRHARSPDPGHLIEKLPVDQVAPQHVGQELRINHGLARRMTDNELVGADPTLIAARDQDHFPQGRTESRKHDVSGREDTRVGPDLVARKESCLKLAGSDSDVSKSYPADGRVAKDLRR